MEADVVVFLLVRKCRHPYFLGMYLPSLYSNELMAFDISIYMCVGEMTREHNLGQNKCPCLFFGQGYGVTSLPFLLHTKSLRC